MIDPKTGDTILMIIAVVAAAFATGFPMWFHHRDCVGYIEGDIGPFHPRDVKIRNDWMNQGRYSFTYDVEFRDVGGKMHYNRCTVSWDAYVDNTVAWDTPLRQPKLDSAPRLARKEFH